MDSLMPFIVVIYLVAAVVGAVMKSLAGAKQAQQRAELSKTQSDKQSLQAPVVKIFSEEESVDPAPAKQWAANPAFVLTKEKADANKADKAQPFDWAGAMRSAVVMSELLREPRSHRPWPRR